ncbi:MAG: alpha/beta hydrolase [Spirochaetota bacterium]
MKQLLFSLIILFLQVSLYSKDLDCDNQPELKYVRFRVKSSKLYMSGTIRSATPRRLKRILNKYPHIKTIVMQCVPGSKDDEANLKAATLVRKRGLNTHIASTGMIASGGTDFFLAGVKRTMGDDVYIGVHAWGTDEEEPTADRFPRNHSEHKKYLHYYRKMGIPQSFYWFTLRVAPAEGMHNMTDAELDKYHILTD